MTLAIALRGDTPRFRENTVPALRSAIDKGADAIAVDLRLTADDHVVLVREEAAERSWGLHRPVRELTLAEIAAVTSEGGQRIPTLMEALAETARPRVVPLLADVASAEAALAADAVAAEHSFTEHMLYSGPVEALRALAARRPGAGLVLDPEQEEAPPGGLRHGLRPRFLRYPADLLTRELIADAHRSGCGVGAWTVNDFAEMARFIGMGVDALVTEEIAELAKLTAEGRGQAEPVPGAVGTVGAAGAPAGTDRPRGRHSG
ncbi:glycerophosphodiester phosphodiesterase [Nocardiopsis sp. CNT-189]|uniref:glycerophosphodiester phosphodiesterase n=1 Tax=Nocardiopsis oceanisediminis TaxID=2816862 RepID=UPI003B37664C